MSQDKTLETLFSRQIGTYGIETMNKLMELKILILGVRGFGMEIAKNVILSGPKLVSLYDPHLVSIHDLGSGYYFQESDVANKRRDEAALNGLKKLAQNTKVNFLEEFSQEKLLDFNVVVQTELIDKEKVIKLNNFCHENNIKFIYSCVLGLFSFIFSDFGKEHIIYDENGLEVPSFRCKNILNEEYCVIELEEGINSFVPGDYVLVKCVEGMDGINNLKLEILAIFYEKNKIVLDFDSRNLSPYINGGIVKLVKKPQKILYQKFENLVKIPFNRKSIEEVFTDSENEEDKIYENRFYLSLILALSDYVENNELNSIFSNHNLDFSLPILEKVRFLFNSMLEKDAENGVIFDGFLDEDFYHFENDTTLNFIRGSQSETMPMVSLIGGFVSQEIIKATGKYVPINQFKFFDCNFIIKEKNTLSSNFLKILDEYKDSRYYDNVLIFGDGYQKKLENLNVFAVGAGAVGCEVLKNCAMLGVSTKGGVFTVTDPDSIEISNLSRQFLFHKENAENQNPKSVVACESIKKMNPKFNSVALTEKLSKETKNIFDENFFEKQDIIISGVDNIDARNYINYICHWYKKNFIDAGTNGPEARVNVVIPGVTKELIFYQKSDADAAHACTLRTFPTKINHCIEWANDNFSVLFSSNIRVLKNFIQTQNIEEYYENSVSDVFDENFSVIKNFIEIFENENKPKQIIKYAIKVYDSFFNQKIIKLINDMDKPNNDDPNQKKETEILKKRPRPIQISNDSLSIDFIESFCKILSHSLGIEFSYNRDELTSQLNEILENKTELEKITQNLILSKEEKIEMFRTFKRVIINTKIEEEIFEKDSIDNFHIDFIHSCSNLRAKNFYIEQCDRNKALMVAGKIISAIATSTASVGGYLSLQLLALLESRDITSEIKGAYMDLGKSTFVLKNAEKAPIQKKSKYDELVIEKKMTVNQFNEFIKENYNLNVFSIDIFDFNIFTQRPFILPKDQKRYEKYLQKINKNIEDIYTEKTKEIKMKILARDETGKVVGDFPLIKYVPN